MELIEFEHVVKRFDGRTVLDGLTFSIRQGEIFCIVGPSGIGKSVTLKHLVRLVSPTSGSVRVHGVDVAGCSASELARVRSRIGYLFQSGALLAWQTVAENVALPLVECTGFDDAEIARRVRAALEAVELADAADCYPGEISGGMQKRAGLARAIVRDADILLYDEPTSGLDPVTAYTINRLIVSLARDRGVTSVVVTHDIPAALSMADRIMLLSGGRAVECASPADFVRSRNREVREFLAAAKGGMPL